MYCSYEVFSTLTFMRLRLDLAHILRLVSKLLNQLLYEALLPFYCSNFCLLSTFLMIYEALATPVSKLSQFQCSGAGSPMLSWRLNACLLRARVPEDWFRFLRFLGLYGPFDDFPGESWYYSTSGARPRPRPRADLDLLAGWKGRAEKNPAVRRTKMHAVVVVVC